LINEHQISSIQQTAETALKQWRQLNGALPRTSSQKKNGVWLWDPCPCRDHDHPDSDLGIFLVGRVWVERPCQPGALGLSAQSVYSAGFELKGARRLALTPPRKQESESEKRRAR
jgi:hypothetical protein